MTKFKDLTTAEQTMCNAYKYWHAQQFNSSPTNGLSIKVSQFVNHLMMKGFKTEIDLLVNENIVHEKMARRVEKLIDLNIDDIVKKLIKDRLDNYLDDKQIVIKI